MLAFSAFITSCAEESDCKLCKQTEYVNGVYTRDIVSQTEFCGTELTDTENEEPVTIGNTTTKWECE